MFNFLKRIFFTWLSLRRIGSYKEKPVVNFYSRFTTHTYIGRNCHFNGLIIRGQGDVYIGDNFHSGKNIFFINTYHDYRNGDALPYDSKKTINKDILIEDNVWIGDRVMVLGGVSIGEGAIIQAGSVVVWSIPKYAIAGGNPARVFSWRDKDNYERLKENKKFI